MEEKCTDLERSVSSWHSDSSSTLYSSSEFKPEVTEEEYYVDIPPSSVSEKHEDEPVPAFRFLGWTALNVLSTVTIVFTNKVILSDESFRHCQVAFAAYHFSITGATLWIVSRPRFGVFVDKRVSVAQIIPLAAAMCVQVILQNVSLAHSSVMFHQLARLLLTPVVAFLNYILYGVRIPKAAILPLGLLCIGVGMVSYYDSLSVNDTAATTSSFGIICALTGVCASAIYMVWIGHYHRKLELNSMQLLLNQAPISAGLLFLTLPWSETPPLSSAPGSMWILILLSGVFASIVNVSQFFIIDLAGPISGTVVGQLKTCIIVGLGWAFSLQAVYKQSIIGIFVALAGMSIYMHVILQDQNRRSGY